MELEQIVNLLIAYEKKHVDPEILFRLILYSDGSGKIEGLQWCCDDMEFTEFEFSSLEELQEWVQGV